MSDGQLIAWLEAAIPGMQRHLEQYISTRKLDHLGELAIAEQTANLVITELLMRKFPRDVEEDEAPPVRSVPSEPKTVIATTSAQGRSRWRRRRRGPATVPVEVISDDTLG